MVKLSYTPAAAVKAATVSRARAAADTTVATANCSCSRNGSNCSRIIIISSISSNSYSERHCDLLSSISHVAKGLPPAFLKLFS
jgi:hypothetical protein